MHGRHASTAKHLLLRLTDAIAGKPQSSVAAGQHDGRARAAQEARRQAASGATGIPIPTERERCTDSLGNLVLVTKDQNDKAGNHEFARKLEVYFNTRGAPAVALNEGLRGRTQWKAREIRARETQLLQLVEELWRFGLPRPSGGSADGEQAAPSLLAESEAEKVP